MKIALITGATRGIGKAIAYYFGKIGCQLIITYNEKETLSKNVALDINKMYNVDVDSIKCDLSIEQDINELYNFVKNKYGHIDYLINNAALSLDNALTEKTKKEFMNVLEVNVVGTFLMIKYFSKLMNNGYIFNISSTDGIDTMSSLSIDYSASKAAINNMTKSMSLCINSKIISICPNWVDTESIREMNQDYLYSEMKRINQKKLINPQEVVNKIDECINNDIKSGSIIRIDGESNE